MKPPAVNNDWDESTSASEALLGHSGTVLGSFFERSVDAIWLLDPQVGVFVDCNQAAVQLTGAESKQQLLRMRPAELSPPVQPDGLDSAANAAETIPLIQRQKAYLFEWVIRRMDESGPTVQSCHGVSILHDRHAQRL